MQIENEAPLLFSLRINKDDLIFLKKHFWKQVIKSNICSGNITFQVKLKQRTEGGKEFSVKLFKNIELIEKFGEFTAEQKMITPKRSFQCFGMNE